MATPTFKQLQAMSASQQDAFFTGYFPQFKGTVTAAWVSSEPALKPFQGQSALDMYQALATTYPNSTPLQRGSTVYQTWLVHGTVDATVKVLGADATALGATGTGLTTAQYLPTGFSSVTQALTAFFEKITDGKMWRSLGWLLLGVVMIIVGVALWVKGSLSIIPVPTGPQAHLGPVSAPILPLAIIGIGMYLTWFSIRYWDSTTKYPTDPLKSVLTGGSLPAPSGQTSATDIELSFVDSTSASGAVVGNAGSPPDVSGTYSLSDLQTLWQSQGGSSTTAFEAANIAMAESGGRPAVTSSNPDGGTNVGLWQLDTKGVGAGYTTDQLSDPATNARITILNTANGTNWSEWADSVVVGGRYVGPTS